MCGMGIHLSIGHTNSVKLLMYSALHESHGLLKKVVEKEIQVKHKAP